MLLITLSLLFCIGCLLALGVNLKERDDIRLRSSPVFGDRYSLGALVLRILFPPQDFAPRVLEDRE